MHRRAPEIAAGHRPRETKQGIANAVLLARHPVQQSLEGVKGMAEGDEDESLGIGVRPWHRAMTFSQGSIWIKSSGQVGLRLDDIRVAAGATCPSPYACVCETETSRFCSNKSECTYGGECVLDDSATITVEIWGQNKWEANVLSPPGPCVTEDCIERDRNSLCHAVLTFQAADDDGQLNVNPSASRVYICPGAGLSVLFDGVIRRIEVRDQAGNLLAMPGNVP